MLSNTIAIVSAVHTCMLHDLIWGVPNAAMIFAFDVIKQKKADRGGTDREQLYFSSLNILCV